MKLANPCVWIASLALVMACGTSQEVTNFWSNPDAAQGKTYRSVFIIAVTADRSAREVVESDLAAAATARGTKATRSVDVYPAGFTKDHLPSKEGMLEKIRELGCDAVFTVSLLDVKSEQRYVPGTTTYAPYPAYGYYGGYYSYVSYAYPIVSTPGYYTTDKTYFLEGNLYDAGTGQIRWSMQSTAYNPSSLKSFSKGYTELLVDELRKQSPGAPKTP